MPIERRVTSLVTAGVEARIWSLLMLLAPHQASREALEDHFGLALASFSAKDRDHAIVCSFMKGWERIRDAAARSRRVPSNSRIVLTSSDFQVNEVTGRG